MQTSKFNQELSRCLSCRLKPCEKACPLGVSPCDFISASKTGNFKTAATQIAARNPLPQTCGLICPENFCQKACIRAKIDKAIEIPCLQAAIMKKGDYPKLDLPLPINKKAAVIGGGPAGLGAMFELLLSGWHVDIYEKSSTLGGAIRLIPRHRLPKTVLNYEIKRLTENERTHVYLNKKISDFNALKSQYDGIILALGETSLRLLNIKGEEWSIPYTEYLCHPDNFKGKKIAISGGGEVALDCAITAKKKGCEHVEMFVRRRQADMRIQSTDFEKLKKNGIIVRDLSSVSSIIKTGKTLTLDIIKNHINADGKAEATNTHTILKGYDILIQALGSYFPPKEIPQGFILAGDMTGSCGTVVQALASGRSAAKKLINGENK